MIHRVRIRNFKAIRDVDVPISPLTVLVGPNDTGKTSFLEAIYGLANSTNRPLQRCFASPSDDRQLVYRRQSEALVGLGMDLSPRAGDGKRIGYDISVRFGEGRAVQVTSEVFRTESSPDPVTHSGPDENTLVCRHFRGANVGPPFTDLASYVGQLMPRPFLASWRAEDLASASRLPISEHRDQPFDFSGYGLATCLAELKLSYLDEFLRVQKEFLKLFPGFKEIRVKRETVPGWERNAEFQRIPVEKGEGYSLVLVRQDDVEVPAKHASGGTLVSLAFLTMAHLAKPIQLLLIEEPENGLHPQRLGEVVRSLRDLTGPGSERQVIMTTHSPLLLDYLDPANVRVFLRDPDGDIVVHSLGDVPDIYDRLRYVMLGELVHNQGEQELVREIPDGANSDHR